MMEINKCYNENCLDTMAKMPDNFVDLTVTSPPYDNLRAYNGYSFDFESIAKELYRVIKQGGVVVWVVGDATIKGSETGTSFRQALYFKEIGFNLHDTMIYKSPKPPLTHNRYEQCFEYMFVFSKGRPKTFSPIQEICRFAGNKSGGTIRQEGTTLQKKHKSGEVGATKYKENVWYYSTGMYKTTADKEAFQHPALFPEQLANDHIISWSNAGDLIYDPFLGGGTTAKMAIMNDRNWVGSEISAEYCTIIEKRIEKALAVKNRGDKLI